MPFLPLFIVIGLFLATSKILQPSTSVGGRDFDEKKLSQALIDYIARESRQRDKKQRKSKTIRVSNSKKKNHSLPSIEYFFRMNFPSEWRDYEHIFAELYHFKEWFKDRGKPVWEIHVRYNWAYVLTCSRLLLDVFWSSAKKILSRK